LAGPSRGGEEEPNEKKNGSERDRDAEPSPESRPGMVQKLSSYVRAAGDRKPRVAHAAR
jgi:hypothetical protein